MNFSDSGGSAAISAASCSAALFDLGVGDNLADQAHRQRGLRVEDAAAHQIEVRTELADRARQALGAAGARHDADLHLRLAEARRLAGDDDIAMHRQFTAATECKAATRPRSAASGKPAIAFQDLAVFQPCISTASTFDISDEVGAGGEGLLGAGEHDDAHAVVLGERIEMFGHLAADGDIEWVQWLRAAVAKHGNVRARVARC